MDLNRLKKPRNKKILAEESVEQPLKAKLTDHIMVKLTPHEKQKIAELAEQKGRKMSPCIRHILKKHGYI